VENFLEEENVVSDDDESRLTRTSSTSSELPLELAVDSSYIISQSSFRHADDMASRDTEQLSTTVRSTTTAWSTSLCLVSLF